VRLSRSASNPEDPIYQNWQLELERQPDEFLGRRFNDLMREARASP